MNILLNTLKQHKNTLSVSVLLFACLLAFVSGSDTSGWSSGFTHPLHGGDHFLTMIAVGVWAAQLRGKAVWLLPITFVSVMSLGGLAGASGLFIPIAELLILASCIVFSVLIVRKVRFSSKINVAIVAFFAFFHGFAHGQEISTSASLVSYTVGFMVATLLLHGAGILIVKLLVLLFALFISQLVHVHSTLQQHFVKQTVIQQSISYQQSLADIAPSPPDKTTLELKCSPIASAIGVKKQLKLFYSVSIPLWLDNAPQLAIRFLKNGVGVTAPPAVALYPALLFSPVLNFANSGALVLITNLFLIISFYLATSFLSSGVGVTSPPTGIFLPVNFCKIIFSPCFSDSLIQLSKPRIDLRMLPFAVFSVRHFFCFKNNNNI